MNNGIIAVDKPAGISSARVVSRIKKCLNVKKVGHTGTLDPFATGLMLVCTDRATRISGFLLGGGKTYEAEMLLGFETDTLDRTGEITNQVHSDVVRNLSLDDIEKALSGFRGDILQKPPVYSALKLNGVPLYRLARRGTPVEKPARAVRIFELEIMAIALPSVFLRVRCSSGTYIRSLCSDIGRKLGCGACLKELRRTENCGFSVNDAIKMDDFLAMPEKSLKNNFVRAASALAEMPEIKADEALETSIRYGRNLVGHIDICNGQLPAEFMKVVNKNNDLLAVLRYEKISGGYGYHCVLV